VKIRAGSWILAAGVAVCAVQAQAEEKVTRERVMEIIEESCTFCHGDRGEASNPIYPRLAHQNRDYIIKQLKNFRDSRRDGRRKSDIMNEQAAGITDAEVEALAEYFASQPPLAHPLPEEEQERLLHKVGEAGGAASAVHPEAAEGLLQTRTHQRQRDHALRGPSTLAAGREWRRAISQHAEAGIRVSLPGGCGGGTGQQAPAVRSG